MKKVLSVILSISFVLSFPVGVIADVESGAADTISSIVEPYNFSADEAPDADSKDSADSGGTAGDSLNRSDSASDSGGLPDGGENEPDVDSIDSVKDSVVQDSIKDRIDSVKDSVDSEPDKSEPLDSIGTELADSLTVDSAVMTQFLADLADISSSSLTTDYVHFESAQNVTAVAVDASDENEQFQVSVDNFNEADKKFRISFSAVPDVQMYSLPERVRLSFTVKGQPEPCVKVVPVRWELFSGADFQYDSQIDVSLLSENRLVAVTPVAESANGITASLLSRDWYEIVDFNSSLSVGGTKGFTVGKQNFTVLSEYFDSAPYTASFNIKVNGQNAPSVRIKSSQLEADVYISSGRRQTFTVNVFNKDAPPYPNVPIEIELNNYYDSCEPAGISLYKNNIHISEQTVKNLVNGTAEEKAVVDNLRPNAQSRPSVELNVDDTSNTGFNQYAFAPTMEELDKIHTPQYTDDSGIIIPVLTDDYSIDERTVEGYIKWFAHDNAVRGISRLTVNIVKDAIPVYNPASYTLIPLEDVNYADYGISLSNEKCSYDVQTMKRKTGEEISRLIGLKSYDNTSRAYINFGITAPNGAVECEVKKQGTDYWSRQDLIERNGTRYYFENRIIALLSDGDWFIMPFPPSPVEPAKLKWTVELNGDRSYIYQQLPALQIQAIAPSIPPSYSFKITGSGNVTDIEWGSNVSNPTFFIGDKSELYIKAQAVIQSRHGDVMSSFSASAVDDKAERAYDWEDEGDGQNYDIDWSVEAQGADAEFTQQSNKSAVLSVTPTAAKGVIKVTAVFSHPDIFDTVTRTLEYKFTAKEHARQLVPTEAFAQTVISSKGTASYQVKATILPSKAVEKAVTWAAYSYENNQKGGLISGAFNKNTVTLRSAGTYLLEGKIERTLADGARGEPVTAQIVLQVLPASQSVKSLSLSQNQLVLSDKAVPFPAVYINGKTPVNLSDVRVVYDDSKISVDTESKTIRSVTNVSFNDKVQVKHGGKTAELSVASYAVEPDVKLQMRLQSSADNTKLFPDGTYKYVFVDANTSREIPLSASQVEVTPDNKLLCSDAFSLDADSGTFTMTGSASGKLNFTIKNDPKKRKGSLSVNTLKIAPTEIEISADESQNHNGRYFLSDRTIALNALPKEPYADLNIKWSVSNSKLASIKKNGNGAVLTLKSPGTVYVYAADAKKNSNGGFASDVAAFEIVDIAPKFSNNVKSIVVNTYNEDLGTVVPLTGCERFSSEGRSAKIVKSVKGGYEQAQGYGAAWIGDALYVAVNRNASGGKYFAALSGMVDGENATAYLPLSIKVETKEPRVSAVANATINTKGRNGSAPLKIRVEGCDVSNVEFEAATNQRELSLQKKDGAWHIVYTGSLDAVQTLSNVRLSYSIRDYDRSGYVAISKVNLKPNESDYKVAAKAPAVFTVGDKALLSSISIPLTFTGNGARRDIAGLELVESKGGAVRVLEPDGANALKFKDNITYSDISGITKLTGLLKVVYSDGADVTTPVSVALDRKTTLPKISGVKLFGAVPVFAGNPSAAMLESGAALQYSMTPGWECVGITCDDKRVVIDNNRLAYVGAMPSAPVDITLTFNVRCNGVTQSVSASLPKQKLFYQR